jgi:hypothetical protein
VFRYAESQLQAAQVAEQRDQAQSQRYEKTRLAQSNAAAAHALPTLEKQYNAVEARIRKTIASNDAVNIANTGILAQLQALSAASSRNSSLAAARWTVLALFFVIEILPVTVKALLNLGQQSSYEKVAIGREEAVADRENVRRVEYQRIADDESQARVKKAKDQIRLGDLSAQTRIRIAEAKAESRFKVHEDMQQRELHIGKHANEQVAAEITKIIDSALKEWGDRVRETLTKATGQRGNGQRPNTTTNIHADYDLPDQDYL